MKSTGTFEEYFFKLLEDITAGGAGSAFGSPAQVYSPDNPTSGDTWNKGDMRIAKGSGIIQTRKGVIKSKRKRRKRKAK
ncbi:MAG: hypothetical protein ACO3UU_15545 [Minisyncoccia bacterium]